MQRKIINNRLSLLFFFFFSLSLGTFAQDSLSKTIVINENGTVTFNYDNPNAKKVKILCDCRLHHKTSQIKRENYHVAKMKRQVDGTWSYTTPPLCSEIYTYQFNVDGKNIPDPTNADSVRVRTEKLSVFIIANDAQTKLYVTDSLKGHVDTVTFHNSKGGKDRNIIVYTPPQYDIDTNIYYPAFYLLHGLNGNETAWQDRGRAINVLDNLITSKRATPMILVMPDANPECLIAQKDKVGLFKNIMLYPSWNKLEFERIFLDIDTFLSNRYRLTDAHGGRIVAGLSAGAKQSANLANMYDSTFKYVGLFSPVVKRKHLPKDRFSYYWIGGGTGDLFHWQINGFRKKMQRKHITYTMYNSIGGHTWRNWRVYLSEFIQVIHFY